VLLLDDTHRLDSSSLPMVDRLMAHRTMFWVASIVAGVLDARLDLLAHYGIAVHRVVGEHPAVHRANH
jgi:hypothetical protein